VGSSTQRSCPEDHAELVLKEYKSSAILKEPKERFGGGSDESEVSAESFESLFDNVMCTQPMGKSTV
jgi:hypothetical protein